MASDPEIKDGFPLPVWMKTKPSRDFEPFATSPPGAEDSFFYIRYPKPDFLMPKAKPAKDLNQALNNASKDLTDNSAFQVIKDKDWSKHTKPCQDVLHSLPISSANASSSKVKSLVLDDDTKGEGTACGDSVIKVATAMISTQQSRGFTVAEPSSSDDSYPPAAGHPRMMKRRSSKSLPTTPGHSPPGSPNSRRKHGNRYMTSPFEPVGDGSGRSWLTMALLGFRKDLASSTSTLAEEDAIENRLQGMSLAESVENLGPAPRNVEIKPAVNKATTQQPKLSKPATNFRPKPTEYRELNFWSPTSM